MSTLFGSISTDEQHQFDVFVIMPFKDEFRSVYAEIIQPVCTEIGLTTKLGDDFFSNRQIINDIWSAINNCNLVIADCTEHNANVFYELGIAHALDKNTIVLTQAIEKIPFDTLGIRHIVYTNSILGGRKLTVDLKEAITKLRNLKVISNPVSVTTVKSHPLQNKDPKRFELSLINDIAILEKESDKARSLHEYDWMELFADSWTKLATGDTHAWEDLGVALIRSKQPQKGISIGEKLIQLNKINYMGYQILGQAHALLGEWEEAKKWQELALGYAPNWAKKSILIELEQTFEAMGLVDDAIKIMGEVLPQLDLIQKPYYEEKLAHLKSIKSK